MHKLILLCTLIFVSLAFTAFAEKAQPADERAAITAVARNYMDAYYTADTACMEHALHPGFHKRTLYRVNGELQIREDTVRSMVEGVRDGSGKRIPAGERVRSIGVLDVYKNAANVKVVTGRWVDYMLLSKWNGEWRVLDVVLQYTKE